MRTAVVFFVEKNRDGMMELTRALARGMEAQGHRVDIVDGIRDVNAKLTIYEYIAIGAEPLSFFGGKLPEKLPQFLSSSGILTGKRSFAWVMKKGIGASRALAKLMKAMEREGMYLKFSDIVSSAPEAEEIGKRLHITS